MTLFLACFVGCQTAARKPLPKSQTPKKKQKPGCRLQIRLRGKLICLDGVWVLSPSFLGTNARFRFQRDRGFYQLVPVFSDAQLKSHAARLSRSDHDTATVRQACSLQGMIRDNTLQIEQRNPFQPWPQTWRYRLEYRAGGFSGQLDVYSKHHDDPKQQEAWLYREGDSRVQRRQRPRLDQPEDF